MFVGGNPGVTVLGPFNVGKSMNGAWGIAIDGNDNVWVSNSMSHSITQLSGDPISSTSGYIGGLQTITGVILDAAGNAWVVNSWDQTNAGFSQVPDEALSTGFAANSAVVFFGLAKPVRTPFIGPAEAQ